LESLVQQQEAAIRATLARTSAEAMRFMDARGMFGVFVDPWGSFAVLA
jgi:hypothetical protein